PFEKIIHDDEIPQTPVSSVTYLVGWKTANFVADGGRFPKCGLFFQSGLRPRRRSTSSEAGLGGGDDSTSGEERHMGLQDQLPSTPTKSQESKTLSSAEATLQSAADIVSNCRDSA